MNLFPRGLFPWKRRSRRSRGRVVDAPGLRKVAALRGIPTFGKKDSTAGANQARIPPNGRIEETASLPFSNFKPRHSVSSHLSSDIQIEGDLNCSTDLIFDGSIKGNITSKGSLTIGQNASVNGNLKAEKAVIEGRVVGNGDFNSCRLSPTSVISGSVNTVSLQMEEGASLEGQCKVGKAKA